MILTILFDYDPFDFTSVYDVRLKFEFHCFVYGCQTATAPFVGKVILPSLNWLCTLSKISRAYLCESIFGSYILFH